MTQDLIAEVTNWLKEKQAKVGEAYVIVGTKRFSYLTLMDYEHPLYSKNFRNFFETLPILDKLHSMHGGDANRVIQEAINGYRDSPKKDWKESLSDRQREILATHRPYVDYHNGQVFLWTSSSKGISEMNAQAFFHQFSGEALKQIKRALPLAIRIFEPFQGNQRWWEAKKEGLSIYHLNSYRPPAWQHTDIDQATAVRAKEDYPHGFLSWVKVLFPDPSHVEAVLDWLSLACFSSPIAFLSLRGARGNGKSTFMHFCRHLVGNAIIAQDKILTDFPADLKEKRLICLDDNRTVGDYEGHKIRKFLLNKVMSFNEKFVQVRKSEKNWASFIFCSNPSEAFYLEYDERRIVSPLMTHHKMEKYMPQEWISYLSAFEAATDGDLPPDRLNFVSHVGYALLARFARKNPSQNLQLKAGYFWDDVLRSLPSFKSFALQTVLSRSPTNNEIDYEELKADYKLAEGSGKIPHWMTFAAWLSEGFSFNGEALVTEGGIDNAKRTFTANPALCGKIKGGVP